MVLTQTLKILAYFQGGGTLTDNEAREMFRCNRLGARIYDLKKRGYQIMDKWEVHRNSYGEYKRYKRYWLAKEEAA